MRLGFIGTGTITAHMVRGLKASGLADWPIVVSPRNVAVAAELALLPGVVVAGSNQAVVDQCEMVLACLPAATGLAVLQGLRFRAGQSVCSAMAGAAHPALTAAVAPARAFCTMMPGFANAFSVGPSLLYPDDAEWGAFLALLGPVHRFDDARSFETAAVFGAMSGASFYLLRHLMRWYVAQGLELTGLVSSSSIMI